MSLIPQCVAIYNECLHFLKTDNDSFIERLGLSEKTICFFAYQHNKLVGYVIVDINSILLLCVSPFYQGKGIGTLLLGNAEEYLYKKGSDKVVLGCGTGKYLCQGVPFKGEINAYGFFKKHGYKASWSSIDMILKLSDFFVDKLDIPKVNGSLTFRYTTDMDMKLLLEAVNSVNPSWCRYFGDTKEAVLIAEYEGELAGFVLLSDIKMPFSENFTGTVGGIGCLGVIPNKRNKGIGMQLAAKATEALKERSLDYSYLGYTWLEEWYSKLGYKPYARFWMGEKIF